MSSEKSEKKTKKKHATDPYAVPHLNRNREYEDVSTVVWQEVLGTNSPRRDRERAVGLTGAGIEGWNCRACDAHNAMLQLYCGVCGGHAPKSNFEMQRSIDKALSEGKSGGSSAKGSDSDKSQKTR